MTAETPAFVMLAAFDLTDQAQQAACFHYSNMQPLCWRRNNIKRAHYDDSKEQSGSCDAPRPYPQGPQRRQNPSIEPANRFHFSLELPEPGAMAAVK